jgi:hypothetical protein
MLNFRRPADGAMSTHDALDRPDAKDGSEAPQR